MESLNKLALWYTKSFKPLVTHDELEPIMAVLGFVCQPDKSPQNGVVWKEYVYVAAAAMAVELSIPLPRPRLPGYRIDGLHIHTYRAFIDAVNFYLDMDDVSELFHIRGMPLHRVYDRKNKFRRMDENNNVFVYRDGTLDQQSTYSYYHVDRSDANGDNNNNNNNNTRGSITLRSKGKNLSIGTVVELKDIIVWTLA